MPCFQLREYASRPLENRLRNAGELRYVDAIAAFRVAGRYFVQEDHVGIQLAHLHVVISQVAERFGELGQLVVVGGKHRPTANNIVQVLRDRPGERYSVISTGATANLVEYDQTPL